MCMVRMLKNMYYLTSKVSPNHPQMLPSEGKSTDKVAAKRTEMIQSACSACEVEQSVWLQMLMREWESNIFQMLDAT